MGRRKLKSMRFAKQLKRNAEVKCSTSLVQKLKQHPILTDLQERGYAVLRMDVKRNARLDGARRQQIIDRIRAENDCLLQNMDGSEFFIF